MKITERQLLNYLKWLEAEEAKADKAGDKMWEEGDIPLTTLYGGRQGAFAQAKRRLKKLLKLNAAPKSGT